MQELAPIDHVAFQSIHVIEHTASSCSAFFTFIQHKQVITVTGRHFQAEVAFFLSCIDWLRGITHNITLQQNSCPRRPAKLILA